jgi:glycosyltransferase involved in cell wall biosynthesis
MNRRVLLISLAYPPSSEVGAFRAARFAKCLPACGWEPIVLTASYASSTTLGDESRMQWTNPSAIVVRTRPWLIARGDKKPQRKIAIAGSENNKSDAAANTPPAANQSTTSISARVRQALLLPFRLPDKYIWWAVPAFNALRKLARQYKPDVIFCTTPPHSSQLIATAFKAWSGIPVVIDLRDPWANTAWGEAHHGRIKATLDRTLERWCVRRADRVILNTPELLAQYQRSYPARWNAKFSAIPNGYDPEVRTKIESLVGSATKSPDQPIKLCHAGSVYGRRDIRPLIEAVALLNRAGRRVAFEQMGRLNNGGEVAHCIANNNASDYITILDQQSHEEALRHMAAADILVVVRQNTPLQVPAKVYEMMLFGKPILALDGEGAIQRMVCDNQLGVVADPVDPVAIAAAIENTIDQIGRPPGEQRAAALRQYDAREQTRQLANVLEAAVESNRRMPS